MPTTLSRVGAPVPRALARRLGPAGAAAGAMVLTMAPSGALAAAPACGAVLTASTVLTADLTCPSGDGLVLSGHDVVLDLGGHTLDGAGTGADGVRVSEGGRGIVVRGGTVRGFADGVVVDRAGGNRVAQLTLVGNGRGVLLAAASGNVVEQNVVTGSSREAVALDGGADDNRVRQNRMSDNGHGIALDGASGNTVEQNAVSGTRTSGVLLLSGAAANVVSRNTVSGSGSDGVVVESTAGRGNVLAQNMLSGNGGDGLRVAAGGTTVARTTATRNAGHGVRSAVPVTDGGGVRAAGNATAPQCVGVTCSTP